MSDGRLPTTLLRRKAIVYVRQSSPGQVHGNLESQRRQYELVETARSHGFRNVTVIDEDLGVSASGHEARAGFQRLVAEMCAGAVGAVLCLEASRLARNGRDWHHLLELCGLVGARVIDADGIYDPRRPNDRLLLGLKGTMSEFELTVLRSRLQDALETKAARGELRMPVPIGYHWPLGEGVILDPDRRIQEAVRLVFRKFAELGSARQVLLWMRRAKIRVPGCDESRLTSVVWREPAYRSVISILKNPFYAGVYARGKSQVETILTDGRLQKRYGRAKPRSEWTVFLPGHHEGYITLEEYEKVQERLARNAYCTSDSRTKSGRGGRALLSGLLRCRRCGRPMAVTYGGRGAKTVRYWCRRAHINAGVHPCITLGALRPDQFVAREVLTVLQPLAIEAAMRADERLSEMDGDRRKALEMEHEQAEYEARLAARRYEACDPDNRLVASELEDRWNAAIERVRECQARIHEATTVTPTRASKDRLLSLASDVGELWDSDHASMRTKQRIVRTMIEEIIVDVDDACREVILVIHWKGGVHSEHRVRKPKPGEHRNRADQDVVGVVRDMAGRWSDEDIAATLNRMGLKTGKGNGWTKDRVRSLRVKRGLAGARTIHDGASCEGARRLSLHRKEARQVQGIARDSDRGSGALAHQSQGSRSAGRQDGRSSSQEGTSGPV